MSTFGQLFDGENFFQGRLGSLPDCHPVGRRETKEGPGRDHGVVTTTSARAEMVDPGKVVVGDPATSGG